MGEMEVGVPPGEIAATVAELRGNHQQFWLRPFGGGMYQVVVPAAGVRDRTEPPTLDDFRRQLRTIAGTDFGVHSPQDLDDHLARWFGRVG